MITCLGVCVGAHKPNGVLSDVLYCMMRLESLVTVGFVKDLVDKRYSHKQVSEHLRTLFPEQSGISPRSVERYCSRHNIHYRNKNLPDDIVDNILSTAVKEVCSSNNCVYFVFK